MARQQSAEPKVRPPAEKDELEAPHVRITGLTKGFVRNSGEVVRAIDGIDLSVGRGEIVVLLGPSGCGKTTLLRSIAGLEVPDSGSIEIDGRTVFAAGEHTHVPAERRRVNMMFQSYALWPHMTVWRNVAYPARTARLDRSRVRELTDRVLADVGITDLALQYPAELSGGQQQRVALARALVDRPRTVLFDEPLSNVDAQVRETLRLEILRMHRELGFTAVYVTHDQTEAMQLADRIVVLREGRIEQQGSPSDVYRYPRSLYVSTFVGTSNVLPGQVSRVASDGSVTLSTDEGELNVRGNPRLTLRPGMPVHAVVRPEDVVVGPPGAAGANCWSGDVLSAMFSGPTIDYAVELGSGRTVRASMNRGQAGAGPGSPVSLSVAADAVHLVSE